MGTNYYLEAKVCPHCGRASERLHIGKSSAGWVFTLHIHPDKGINNLEDWIPLFEAKDSKISDEYGADISPSDMRSCIMARWHPGKQQDSNWFADNKAEVGPMGLARPRLGQSHGPVKHGVGTWSCFVGQEDSW